MKFERTKVSGFEMALHGMREPMMSHAKSDSYFADDGNPVIGDDDMRVARMLLSTGSPSDSKFLRMIHVQVEITAPQYWLAELDTYKVATVRNSSSLQHKGASRDYRIDDFTFDDGDKIKEFFETEVLPVINQLRILYRQTNDYKYFRPMRQLIPMSYNYQIVWDANYETLRTIYRQRIAQPHRLKEWTVDFASWLDTLPYAKDFIMEEF